MLLYTVYIYIYKNISISFFLYIYIYIYSAAGKFVNPLKCSTFLHKYDPNHNQFFVQVLNVDREKPIKQMRQRYFLCHLFLQKNDPILQICEW